MKNKLFYLLFLPLLAGAPAAEIPTAERTLIIHLPETPRSDDLSARYQFLSNLAETMDNGVAWTDSSKSFQEAIKRIIGDSPLRDNITTQMSTSTRAEFLRTGQITIHIQIFWLDPRLNQLADSVADIGRQRILDRWNSQKHSLQQRLENKQQLQSQLTIDIARSTQQIDSLESKLRTETGRLDFSPAGLQTADDALELERQKVQLDLAGLKARRDALQDAIVQQVQKSRDAQKDDLTLKALAKAVDASNAKLQRLQQMVDAKAAPKSDAEQAEVALFEAQAALAERTNSTGNSAESMSHWNQELVDASIDQREKEARLALATTRLAALISAADESKQLQSNRESKSNALEQKSQAQRDITETTTRLQTDYAQQPLIEIQSSPTSQPSPLER
jgi:hypothetical protein